MTREEFIKQLIKENGYNIKSFASDIGIPYTTLLSMLNSSIGGAAVESVIKICEKLNIPVEILKEPNINSNYVLTQKESLTVNEKFIIKKYRLLTDDQKGAIENNMDYFININKVRDMENGNMPSENAAG